MKHVLMAAVIAALLAVCVAALLKATAPPEPAEGMGGSVASGGADAEGESALPKITPREAYARWKANPGRVVLLDVRTDEEYAKWYIPGTLHIPVESPDFDRLAAEKIPGKDTEIILFCRTGRRARPASEQLREQGYNSLYNMGGIIDWPYETAGTAGS